MMDATVLQLLERIDRLERLLDRTGGSEAPGKAPTWLSGSAGGSAAIDFTNISQAYRSLELVISNANSGGAVSTSLQFSSDGTAFDTGSNYDYQYLYGNAATTGAGESFAGVAILVANQTNASNVMSPARVLIPDYRNTSHYKPILALYGRKDGTSTGNLFVVQVTGFWRNTAAVKGIHLFPSSGTFASASRVDLYGIP